MFVIGTAGHIDHGKSSLVLAMTGIDPDRLPEEKERGMTIDLGFAWLNLPSGKSIGIVDVPGHERFIKNMVAGVGGIDAVILVIAADDGWMPQTEEHFNIIKLLGINSGIVALTKKDLVSEDFLNLQIDDIRNRLQSGFLADSPIIPVSSTSGEGIAELLSSLDEVLDESKRKPDIGAARLFIDRRFTLPGMGTIVTGTLLEGELKVDDQIIIEPQGIKARIRNLQTHKRSLKAAIPGSRVAINLAGIEKEQIGRGDAICRPDTIVPSKNLGLKIELLESSRHSLKHGTEVSFLLGTADINGRIFLFENDTMKPGQSRSAGILLSSSVAVKIGDRFIIRLISPPVTIGGGIVLDYNLNIGSKYRQNQLTILNERSILSAGSFIITEIRKKGWVPKNELCRNVPFSDAQVELALKEQSSKGSIVISGDRVISRAIMDKYAVPAKELIAADHLNRPWAGGLEPGILSKKLNIPTDELQQVIEYLAETEQFIYEKGLIRAPNHAAELKPDQKSFQGKLFARLSASPLSAPSRKDFVDENPMYEVVINFLRDKGDLIELKGGILITANDFEKIITRLKEFLSQKGKATASDIKTHLNTSRKYVIPLLERLDQMEITIREGDLRRLP